MGRVTSSAVVLTVFHASCISREVQFSMGDKAQKFSEVEWSTRRKEKAELFPPVWVVLVVVVGGGEWLFFAFLLSEDPGDTQGRAENRVDQKGSPPQRQPQAMHTEAWLAEDTFRLSKLV